MLILFKHPNLLIIISTNSHSTELCLHSFSDQVLVSAVEGLGEHGSNPRYVEDIFEDVENLSDSDPDIDTISIHSTPKPKLKYVCCI